MRIIDLEVLIAVLIIARVLINPSRIAKKWKDITKEYLDSIITSALIALFLITYIVRTSYIPSGSMKPTFVPVDYILVNKFIYRFSDPQRGDIIVFRPPHKENSPDYVKRLIGLSDETIEVKDGTVLINGQPLKEDYIPEDQKPWYNYGPVKIPEDSYFMMGDNRNNSEDSHVWGFLPRKNIVGKAFCIFWPAWRAKLL